MDVCFYEEDIMPITSSESTMLDKSKLKLDFSQAGKNTKRQNSANSILTSPDLNLLKLGSPELEKLIMSSCGGILTTPTPSQFLKGNFSVTEEQEMYARGFVDALQKLHAEQGSPGTEFQGEPYPNPVQNAVMNIMSTTSSATAGATNSASSTTVTTTTQSCPTKSLSTISFKALPLESMRDASTVEIFPAFQTTERVATLQNGSFGPCFVASSEAQARIGIIKREAVAEQVVPGTPPPPLPPIDLDLQEAVKTERKRLRNRQAASKCRKRKLERESDLEKKVDQLKEKNSTLQSEAQCLRQQVMDLKQVVMSHVREGCEIILSH